MRYVDSKREFFDPGQAFFGQKMPQFFILSRVWFDTQHFFNEKKLIYKLYKQGNRMEEQILDLY